MNARAQTQRQAESSFRLQWLDYSRGLNILVVVCVHVYWSIVHAGLSPGSQTLRFLFDCSAAMALFFFISGSFISKTVDLPFPAYLKTKLRDLAYPYFVWVVLSALLHSLAGGNVNAGYSLSDLWRSLYDPPWHFWFIYALFVTHLVYWVVRRAGLSPVLFLAFAFVFTLTRGTEGIQLGWGVLYMVRNYLFWFALGAFIGLGQPLRWLSGAGTPLAIALTVVGFALAAGANALGAREEQWSMTIFVVFSAVAQMSLCVLLERYRVFPAIALWGRRSLEIYVAHVVFLAATRIVLLRVFGVHDVLVHAVLGTAAGLYGPVVLHWACDRLNVPYLFSLRARPAARVRTGSVRAAAPLKTAGEIAD